MVRFIHTADWQLGMRARFLTDEARPRFVDDRFQAVRAVAELAVRSEAAFVVVAGDVFDDNQVQRQTVLRAVDALRSFPSDLPVLLLPGNHDPLDAGSVFDLPDFADNCPDSVRIVRDQEPIEVVPGVEVVGAPFPVRHPVRNPARDLLEGLRPTTGLRILLAHGGVPELSGEFDQAALLPQGELEAAVADGRVSYVALGDRHSTTDVGASGRIWFAGAPEPTRYSEQDPGNALVVDLDRDRVAVTPHSIGRWRFRQQVLEVTGDAEVASVLRWLEEPSDKARTIGRLGLRGELGLEAHRQLEAALDTAGEVYASFRRWPRHWDLITRPDEEDLERMAVSGFVADAVAELRGLAAGGSEEATEAGDALALLYRLVGSR